MRVSKVQDRVPVFHVRDDPTDLPRVRELHVAQLFHLMLCDGRMGLGKETHCSVVEKPCDNRSSLD